MKRLSVAALIVVAALGILLNAQAPSFEVASIKLNKTNDPQSVPPIQPGRLTLTNRTLRSLVQFAYAPIEQPQIVGGADWADRDRFDITAKMEGTAAPGRANAEAARLGLRTLLAERFHLKLRRESRELPVYALVVARADGRLGVGLRPRPDLNCAGFVPKPGLPDLKGNAPLCGYMRGGQGTLTYRGVTLALLAGSLTSGRVDRVVIDQTQLSGPFDIDLTWAVETDPNASPDAPSIFTALQEQLGLKLEPTRAPVEVLVIEDAQRPTPD
jgi:uncharacterized protein (TIGR03435 family)